MNQKSLNMQNASNLLRPVAYLWLALMFVVSPFLAHSGHATWESMDELSSSRDGRVFFDEHLPALMTRALVLDTAALPKNELLWILTGPCAGLTVVVHNDSVVLLERFYDSFGLHLEGTTKVGGYFREKVFVPGSKYRWDEMIRRATREPLTPKCFVAQFVR